ncbi:MAG: hypothetical protein FJW40_13015 [Acidobacteria bacterium]|nr:hypothetical protein [Acidobacteriota bacterium]
MTKQGSDRGGAVIKVLALLVLIGALAGGAYFMAAAREPRFNAEYQAVLLAGGQVYFGKLENLSSHFLTLTDVYYVQTVNNPETKQPNSVLVKRGKEWHGPDRMMINRDQLILIEPVNPNSRVASLIAEQKKQN